jgi:hypothetical protein
MPDETALFFNVLIKKTDGEYLAHCLELDLVTTAPTLEQVKEDVADVIASQVDYAFNNDNLDYLYHPAPPEVWAEFFACRGSSEDVKRSITQSRASVPPWIIAKTCRASNLHHA